jgi:hypothetical protein
MINKAWITASSMTGDHKFNHGTMTLQYNILKDGVYDHHPYVSLPTFRTEVIGGYANAYLVITRSEAFAIYKALRHMLKQEGSI